MPLPLVYNVRNLRVRWKVTSLAVSGIALVVLVIVALMAMASGLRHTLSSTGSPENAILIQRSSSTSELTSGLSLDEVNLVTVDSRVAREMGTERPLASPEMVVVANLNRRDTGQPTNVTIRGVTPMAFNVRAGIQMEEGKRLEPGSSEIIVGSRISRRIAGLDLGSRITIQRREWHIVGIFSAAGSGFESEVWGDVDVMRQAFNRGAGYNSLALRLVDPSSVASFDKELQTNPQVRSQLKGERTYYDEQAGPVATNLIRLAGFVGFVMGIGAVFGAMNTMYAIVSARTRELATLRALGFSRLSVLSAIVLESTLLALAGGLLGCLLALPVNGLTGATGNVNFSELAFAFRVTPEAIGAGLLFAVTMGALGGLLPAVRAALLPISAALREG